MANIPENLMQPTVTAIYQWYERKNEEESKRAYLGWSELGQPCERALWHGFRMSGGKKFEGRMLRLFDTGHREEDRVLQELRAIGCEVWARDTQTGKQFACEHFGGHLRGHLDAVVKGLPESPKTPHLVDVKTCNTKKFSELQKKGMRDVYPKYWAQAQGYMGMFGLKRAMYIFVNKDDDRIHTVRFEFNEDEFMANIEKAGRVIFSQEPPPRISDDPAWFECKFCDHHATCHGTQAPAVTCRSCLHSTPERDGSWSCARHQKVLSIDEQRKACQAHRYIPAVLHWAEPVDASDTDNWVKYRMKSGGEFVNGQHPQGVESAEIHAAADKAALAMMQDDDMQALRADFGGRVVA
jgi:hypothetical protein